MVSFKDLRFCKIRKATKKPFEEDWPNKPYTWDEIQEHIQKEQNYGVLCGYEGLIVIDADSQEVRDAVDKELPPTFKVETGSKGFHYYNICKDIKKKIVLQTAEKHYGEIQGPGAQVVGPGCYSEDTEMLTLEGFKGINEIKDTDKIATINKKGFIEYHFPTYVFKYDYDQPLIHFRNKSTDLLVTPNHRMYIKKSHPKKELNFQEAETLNPTFYIKRNANWEGKDQELFTPPLPQPIYKSNNKDRKRIDTVRTELINIPINNWLNFFGWWLSEGSLAKGKGYSINITQSPGKYFSDIKKMLENLKVNYHYNPGSISFRFQSKQIYEYLFQFGDCKKKFVPAWIKNLPPKRQMVFLNSLFKGDGSFEKGKFRKYYSASRRLRDDVQEMLLKCGFASSTHIVERRNQPLPQGRICKYSKSYVISVGNSLYSKITKKTKEDYKGKVWCVEVPNNTVFVRRNGKTAWCGNSVHPNGNIYKVVNDVDIAEISKEQLTTALKPFMKDVAEREDRAMDELKDLRRKFAEDTDINSIAITSVISTGKLKKANNGEYYGSNPWHGSSTKMNFWINPYKNLAHCFRCDCGLNVAKVIALEEGISKGCSSKLTKDEFMKVLQVAQQKYGLAKPENPLDAIRAASGKRLKKVIDTFFDKGDLARQIYTAQPYFYDSGRNWWLWNGIDKCWIRRDETDILNMVGEHSTADTIKSKDRVEILEAMKQEGRRKVPKPVKPTWIQFKDLIVDVEDGSEIKASPDYFVTNPIPWSMHQTSEDTPVMDKIFAEWVGEDNVLLLHQILAFCLLPDYPINRLFCLIGTGMNGKCHPYGVTTLMADGSWKDVSKIKVGDEIISPQIDGTCQIAKVLKTHSRWEPNIYEVREQARDKKLLYRCAGNHEIPVIRTFSPRVYENGKMTEKRADKRILDNYEAQHIAKMKNSKSAMCSFTTTAVEFNQPDANIEPFCLGAFLGDGYLGSSLTFSLSEEKRPIIEYFKEKYPQEVLSDKRSKGIDFSVTSKGKFMQELLQLEAIKQSGNKFIPKVCLISSIEFRKKLLSGLLATDGFVQQKTGAIYYTTKSPQLADDIVNLVFSLGGYARNRKVKKSYKRQDGIKFWGDYNELSIRFDNPLEILDLKVKKKMERLHINGKSNWNENSSVRNIAIQVIPTNKGETVYGFEVDSPSHWFVTNNWMITHNSKYLELMSKFIGKTNVTSTELDLLLESRFEITRLHKKLVCQMGETNFAEMSKTSMLKKLTGGDLIGFEYKGKDPFDEKNYAKIIISTNNLPTTTDKTVGFYRRWDIIDFPNQFTEKKDILKDIPEEEYLALARKSIKILKALLVDRKFHNEGTVEERQKKFEDRSNPFDKFWKEFVEEDGGKFIWKHEFERKFNDWCRDNRFREFSETTIGVKMKERGLETIRREADWFTDGMKKSLRAWAGITWKDKVSDNYINKK